MDLPELHEIHRKPTALCAKRAFVSAHICLAELWHMKAALPPFLTENSSSAALHTPCLVLT